MATVGRWHRDFLERRITERQLGGCPEVLGMDEHFFTRRRGYATTLCDLERHRVYDVALGRSEQSLAGFFEMLQGRDRVRMVCIDLSATYRSIVRRYFPNARIVADRFHVIRLVNHHFLATWKTLDPVSSRNRGLRSLMRRHGDRISPEQKTRLSSYFGSRPEIGAIYGFKQELCGMFRRKTCSRRTCQRMIPRLLALIEQLKGCGLETLVVLGNTLADWIEEIVCMWRYTKNNGITEGFHNKMKMLVRRAYGFRNFENCRLRVRALCSQAEQKRSRRFARRTMLSLGSFRCRNEKGAPLLGVDPHFCRAEMKLAGRRPAGGNVVIL